MVVRMVRLILKVKAWSVVAGHKLLSNHATMTQACDSFRLRLIAEPCHPHGFRHPMDKKKAGAEAPRL